MTRRKRFLVAGLSLSIAGAFGLGYWASHARAAGIPATAPLVYSGVLTDMNGTPLTGMQNILLQVYGAAAGGTALCGSAPASVMLVAGAFQVPLADNCTAIVHSTPDLWIDVLVGGASVGRAKLGAVPFAVEASHAVSADMATSALTAGSATTATTAANLAAGPIAGGLQVLTVNNGTAAPTSPCAISIGTAVVDCTCPDGTFVVSGGGDAGSGSGHFIRESRATTTNTWRVTCTSGTTDVLCVTYNVVCSHIGP
jgi:hypothetical protein